MSADILLAILGMVSVGLAAAAVTLFIRLRRLQARYKSIRDVEAESRRLKDEASRSAEETTAAAARELERLRGEMDQQRKRRDDLLAEYTTVAATHERL
jgi:flagellar motility protein MotE (MotC chaperone)